MSSSSSAKARILTCPFIFLSLTSQQLQPLSLLFTVFLIALHFQNCYLSGKDKSCSNRMQKNKCTSDFFFLPLLNQASASNCCASIPSDTMVGFLRDKSLAECCRCKEYFPGSYLIFMLRTAIAQILLAILKGGKGESEMEV